jgi:3-oxoadipate enol-lactonase
LSAPAAAETFDSRGVRLGYDRRGSGEALLFLHAFPLSRRMWREQMPALAGSALCLAIDLPGFGASELPPERGSAPACCRMEEMAAHAVALLDHLRIERAVVCGLSMGGYVALALCAAYPGRLSGLVLAGTRAGADGPEGRAGRLEMASRVEAEGTRGLAAAMVPKLLGVTTRRTRPDLVTRVERWIGEAPPTAVAAAQRGMAERRDRGPGLAAIRVPVLVVVGDEDTISPPAEAAALQQAIPGAELRVLAAAGHLSNLEQPAAFNRAVAGLLRRRRAHRAGC